MPPRCAILVLLLGIYGSCNTYQSNMKPSLAGRDFGKILTKCTFTGDVFPSGDEKNPQKKAMSLFQQATGNEASFTVIDTESISVNKGASGLDYLTGFSLGLIPSFRIDEDLFMIKVRQETPTEIRSVRHHITYGSTIWLFAIPFALWPSSNEDRLFNKLREIYSGYCAPINTAAK